MFGFPNTNRADNFQLKKNLLKSITLQLKFSNTSLLSKKENIVKILSPQFPKNRDLAGNTIEIRNVNNVPQIIAKPTVVSGIYFEDTLQKTFQITEDTISYTFDGLVYKNIESFWAEIKPNLFAVLNECGIKDLERIGLRKINLLPIESGNNTKIIEDLSLNFNDSILASFLALPSRDYLNSGVFNMSFKEGDNNLVINFGLLPSDKPVKNVVLDIDTIQIGKVSVLGIENKLFTLNKEIFNIFTWALRDEAIKRLNE